MSKQIPAACKSIQVNIDDMNADLAELQLELRTDPDINKVLIQKAIAQLQLQIKGAEENLATCIINNSTGNVPPPDGPLPAECAFIQHTIDQINADRAELLYEAIHDPDINQILLAQAIAKLDQQLLEAKNQLQSCKASNHPIPPPATKPVINTDTTKQNVSKVIYWSVLQNKVDELINKRTDPPIFSLRFHNQHHIASNGAIDNNPPNSNLTIFMLEAVVINGKVATKYSPVTTQDLGQLDSGFYFNDINSSTMSISISPASQEPFMLTVNFETGGPAEVPSTTSNPLIRDLDFQLFNFSIKLSFDKLGLGLNFLSWVDKIANLKDDELDKAITQYVLVHVQTPNATDAGGAFQKAMRGKIYSKLKDPTTRLLLNSMLSKWILGGKGVYDVTSLIKDEQKITLNYLVPANKLDPFPESMIRPAGWPFYGNPNPTIKLPLTNSMSNIKHLVVLMMENRSFDHMLGYLSLPVSAGGMGRTDVDGLKGNESNSFDGVSSQVFPFAVGDTAFPLDPSHSYEPVFRQINAAIDSTKKAIPGTGKMDGFIKSAVIDKLAGGFSKNIMGYQPAENVPVYDAMSRDFAISDRWFSSHPGPTFSNRFYEVTGRLNLASGLKPEIAEDDWEFNNSSPLTPVFQKTVFDYLTDYQKNFDPSVSWKYYEQGYSFLRFFSKHTFNGTNIVHVNDPANGFFSDAKNGTLPSVSYIDPHFVELPPGVNADGPVADIKDGQEFVRRVVNAVVTSPSFSNTLLVIIYDEHGGFYDHVPPPAAVPFSIESPIKTYGVRVPAFFVSPWVKPGSVFGHDADAGGQPLYFDHTSVLKTIASRFMSKNPPYMGARFEAATDISAVLNTTFTRYQFLPFIKYNLQFNGSNLLMSVEGGSIAPGTILVQHPKSGTAEQDFSFELVNGWLYIRSHSGRHYVTVDVPVTGNTAPPGIRQDAKYTEVKQGMDARYQLWRCTLLDPTGIDKTSFIVTNNFFSNKILQSQNTQNGTRLILTDKPATFTKTNSWTITSPLMSK